MPCFEANPSRSKCKKIEPLEFISRWQFKSRVGDQHARGRLAMQSTTAKLLERVVAWGFLRTIGNHHEILTDQPAGSAVLTEEVLVASSRERRLLRRIWSNPCSTALQLLALIGATLRFTRPGESGQL